jgi:hypothetical protein
LEKPEYGISKSKSLEKMARRFALHPKETQKAMQLELHVSELATPNTLYLKTEKQKPV